MVVRRRSGAFTLFGSAVSAPSARRLVRPSCDDHGSGSDPVECRGCTTSASHAFASHRSIAHSRSTDYWIFMKVGLDGHSFFGLHNVMRKDASDSSCCLLLLTLSI